jgi:transcriptional regulator with XRE-family HTH domain
VRRILAEHDIGALFRVLRDDAGLTQRQIAELTGMQQSEVCEILAGRKVMAYDVLVRIAKGLGIPRALMGLSYGEDSAYGGDEATVTKPPEEVDEDVQRRDALAVGFLATLGFVPPFAALEESARPGDIPLPERLGASDVAEIKSTRSSYGLRPSYVAGRPAPQAWWLPTVGG